MRRGRTWPWIRMRPFFAQFSEPVWSSHLPSWADFITTTSGCRFSAHTAARHLSFKKAAGELGVTPTAISHQIRLLEDICGQPLFRRHPRPLALSGAGEQLFPVIRNGFDVFATAIESASAKRGR